MVDIFISLDLQAFIDDISEWWVDVEANSKAKMPGSFLGNFIEVKLRSE